MSAGLQKSAVFQHNALPQQLYMLTAFFLGLRGGTRQLAEPVAVMLKHVFLCRPINQLMSVLKWTASQKWLDQCRAIASAT